MGDHWVDWLIVTFALVVLPVNSLLAGRSIAHDASRHTLLGHYRWIILRGLIIIVLVIANWLRAGRSLAALGMDFQWDWPVVAGFVIDLMLVINVATLIFGRAIPADKREPLQAKLNASRIIPRTPGEFRLFPFVILVGSTAEEILYRGFLIWFFAPLTGAVGAALLSSLAFGLAHMYQGRSGVLRTTLIGLLFAAAFLMTRNLWWLIGTHILLNCTGYLLALKLRRAEADEISAPSAEHMSSTAPR